MLKKIERYLYIVSPLLLLASLLIFYLTGKFEVLSIVTLVAGVGIGILFFVRFYDEIVGKITKRKVRYGLNSTIISIVVLALVVIVYLVLFAHNKKFDLTESKRFSLSKQTEELLERLSGPVRVYAFFSKNQETSGVRELLEQYRYIYRDFEYEIIDPDLNPGRVQEMGVTAYGEVIIEYGGKKEKIKSQSEEGITNTLIKLSQTEKKKLYFVSGHGERSINDYQNTGYDRIRVSIQDENFEVEEILLLREEAVPEDCAVLITAGPTKDYDPYELSLIERYILEGGRYFVLLDPTESGAQLAGLTAFLERYGIVAGDDVIIDPLSRVLSGDYFMPVVNEYTYNPITRDFGFTTFLRLARSIDVRDTDTNDNTFPRVVATTGESSWAETDKAELFSGKKARFDRGIDVEGPVPVMAYSSIGVQKEAPGSGEPDAERSTEDNKEAYIFVVGDSDFISNSMYQTQGNKDLFLNAVNFLADRGDLVSIRPKDQESVYLTMTARQGRLAFFISMVAVPLFVIVIGLYINIQRRVRS
ncbi:MAG: GldG family protein [Spirochaetes bacterium]|nr:GldG family protein [Spirochaetota bacterium]